MLSKVAAKNHLDTPFEFIINNSWVGRSLFEKK